MSKLTTASEAVKKVKPGDTLLVGGFLACGNPTVLLSALLEQGTDDLCVVSNDMGVENSPLHHMMTQKKISRILASYIGLNPEASRQYEIKEVDITLIPPGSLAEKSRAGGAGLGGLLTTVGIGTVVEQGKQKITLNEVEYLLEEPIRGDVAFIYASKADKKGNLFIHGSARNFNMLMPAAADYVVAQVDEIVEVGELCPDDVCVPGIFIDAIVLKGAE